MKLIVDSNVLFSFFWKTSITRELIINSDLILYAPEFALVELNKYAAIIIDKTKLSTDYFKKMRMELAIFVEFIPERKYVSFLKKADALVTDKNDVDFVALSLMLDCPLWTQDKELQDCGIKVLTTKEIIDLMD